MKETDIRWIQRFNNFNKALLQLKNAVELTKERKLSKLEEQGLIQGFEYTHELAWNTITDFYKNQGETGIHGSRDASRLAFKRGLIENGEIWMDMIKSRNKSSHTYNEDTAEEIATYIVNKYYDEFISLKKKLAVIKEKELKE